MILFRDPSLVVGGLGSITSTTTTAGPTTTSTSVIVIDVCPEEEIYGEYSDETELLRAFRDKVLRKTPEGQELIRLYYQCSPAIVRAMEKDKEFKKEVKGMIDEILLLIREGVCMIGGKK